MRETCFLRLEKLVQVTNVQVPQSMSNFHRLEVGISYFHRREVALTTKDFVVHK